jgi:hypothetical protein
VEHLSGKITGGQIKAGKVVGFGTAKPRGGSRTENL